jgi:hypothetical protein
VTFHDVDTCTAHHIEKYMRILLDAAVTSPVANTHLPRFWNFPWQ